MKKSANCQRKNQDGSVLLAVLTIMTFASILAATALTFVNTASKKSFDNINQKQSYYTAQTCLETFIESVLSPDSTNLNEFINIANNGGGTCNPIDIDGMGTCTISVQKPAGLEYIKVISTAEINGKEDTVVCYLRPLTQPGDTNFKNAVELTGSGSAGYNNVNVIGGFADSNNSNEEKTLILSTNDSTVEGQLFQYGSIVIGVNPKFSSGVRGEGFSMTATKHVYFAANTPEVYTNIVKKNDSKSNFLFANASLVSSVNNLKIGRVSSDITDGVRPNDVDVFAHGIVISRKSKTESATEYSKKVTEQLDILKNDNPTMQSVYADHSYYEQYGNIYCFSGGEENSKDGDGNSNTDAELAGNMVLERGARITVYGDVYISGDLYIGTDTELNIYGNLYVNGEIKGNVTSLHVKAEEASSLPASARREAGTTGFIYCTSFKNSDTCKNSATFNAQTDILAPEIFAGFDSGRGKVPSNKYEGTKFIYHAEDLLVSANKEVSTISTKYIDVCKNKDNYTLDKYPGGIVDGQYFDYIINGSCYLGEYKEVWWPEHTWKYTTPDAGRKILVNVQSSDIVVVIPNEASFNNNTIIVKNDTKQFEKDDANKPAFCYFTVDTYTDQAKVEVQYKKDDEGNFVLDNKGNKIVEDSTHEGFIQDATIRMDNTLILDYGTWKNTNLGIGNKPYNITDNAISTAYTPENGLGYIVTLLTEGTKLVTSNQCFFETTIYGRQATVDINQGKTVSIARGNEQNPLVKDYQIAIMGSAVVGQLVTHNTLYITYFPPSNKSDLAKLGNQSANEVVGYEVLKYTQDLS